MVANILSFKPLSTFSSLLLFSLTEKKKSSSSMSSYLRSKCSSSIQSGYSCIPGIVILTHLGFFPPFISFVRTGSLPSFTIVCFCQLYEETLFWLFLSIFYQNHSILCLYCLMGFLKTPYYSFWCGFQ